MRWMSLKCFRPAIKDVLNDCKEYRRDGSQATVVQSMGFGYAKARHEPIMTVDTGMCIILALQHVERHDTAPFPSCLHPHLARVNIINMQSSSLAQALDYELLAQVDVLRRLVQLADGSQASHAPAVRGAACN